MVWVRAPGTHSWSFDFCCRISADIIEQKVDLFFATVQRNASQDLKIRAKIIRSLGFE